jgi:hypothetical protein
VHTSFNKASLKSPVIELYLIIHTFIGATAHTSCVPGRLASLLHPHSEVEELLLIHMQCDGPHGAAFRLTASSLLDRQQTVTIA